MDRNTAPITNQPATRKDRTMPKSETTITVVETATNKFFGRVRAFDMLLSNDVAVELNLFDGLAEIAEQQIAAAAEFLHAETASTGCTLESGLTLTVTARRS